MLNKKARILSFVEIATYCIMAGLVATFIISIMISFANEKYETHHLDARMLTTSLIYSADCLAYNGDAKTYLGIIDIGKFSEERLISCFFHDNMGYTIKLVDLQRNEIKSASPNFKLNSYLPVCKAVKDYKCSSKENYVLYEKEGKFYPGILITEVITLA